MLQFTHIIRDPLGVHARPAGLLARTAKDYAGTEITIARADQSVKATQLMKLMGMGLRQGDQVTVTAEGADEQAAIAAMQAFFSENL